MDAWFRLGFSAFSLALESQQVMALRLLQLGSPAATCELSRLLPEKIEAFSAAALAAAGSAARGEAAPRTLQRVVRSYRRRVRRNARRLTRQAP